MDHDGAAFSFSSLKDSESVLLEVRDHMMRFHELMFNMIPDPRSIDEKTTKAFGYGDSSVMTFYQRIKEKGYYDDLIKSFSSTEFFLDSVVVDSKLPSGVKTYGKVLSVRESSATLFSVESSCIISSVGRCAANPHGLWIQKYSLDKFEETEKRKR